MTEYFGQRVRTLRRAKGLSQPKLARKLGISNGAVGNWETTDTIPRHPLVLKLADLLETTPGFLYSGETVVGTPPAIVAAHLDELFAALAVLDAAGVHLRRAAEKLRPKGHARPALEQASHRHRGRGIGGPSNPALAAMRVVRMLDEQFPRPK